MVNLEPLGLYRDLRDYRDEGIKMYDCAVNGVPMCLNHLSASNNPHICAPQGMDHLQFPRTMVVMVMFSMLRSLGPTRQI